MVGDIQFAFDNPYVNDDHPDIIIPGQIIKCPNKNKNRNNNCFKIDWKYQCHSTLPKHIFKDWYTNIQPLKDELKRRISEFEQSYLIDFFVIDTYNNQ